MRPAGRVAVLPRDPSTTRRAERLRRAALDRRIDRRQREIATRWSYELDKLMEMEPITSFKFHAPEEQKQKQRVEHYRFGKPVEFADDDLTWQSLHDFDALEHFTGSHVGVPVDEEPRTTPWWKRLFG